MVTQWKEFPAPDHARVLVCGWQERHGDVAGYWWWDEDSIIDGKPFKHPTALYWTDEPSLPSVPPKKERV